MINNDRIVPITAIDLISMYGLILIAMLGTNNKPVALSASTTNGEFEVSEAGTFILDEPLKSCNTAAGLTRTHVYFVPAYDYSGFTVNGAAVTTQGGEVTADGKTLYHAIIGEGEIEIEKAGY